MNPIGDFLTVILIGTVVGLVLTRYGRSWFGQHLASVTGATDATFILVGIAGAFIGFHLGLILELTQPILLYLLAVAGAVGTVYAWRGR